MINCSGFMNNCNCYLWLLIIILLTCCGGCGCINNIVEKICGCGYLLPLLLVILCCCGTERNRPRETKPFPGCTCK